MAISFVAASAVATGGGLSGAVSCSPTLPTGTASGDRVFVGTVGTTTADAVNTGWARLVSVSLGTGTLGAGTGQRIVTVDYRDYDGVWTMPSFGQASQSNPTIVGAALTYRKAAGETWQTPTQTSGSDTTVTGTAYSATGAANLSVVSADLLLAVMGTPANLTTTAGAMTATGLTMGTVNERADGGFATGNDAAIHVFDAFPTGTETAAPVQTATVSTSGSSSGGTVFVRQTVASAVAQPRIQIIVSNPAIHRASRW